MLFLWSNIFLLISGINLIAKILYIAWMNIVYAKDSMCYLMIFGCVWQLFLLSLIKSNTFLEMLIFWLFCLCIWMSMLKKINWCRKITLKMWRYNFANSSNPLFVPNWWLTKSFCRLLCNNNFLRRTFIPLRFYEHSCSGHFRKAIEFCVFRLVIYLRRKRFKHGFCGVFIKILSHFLFHTVILVTCLRIYYGFYGVFTARMYDVKVNNF